jgi:HNH endonuclease
MAIRWNSVFENSGSKVVTETDKNKGAYVPNAPQRAAIKAAGISPSLTRPADEFKITILNDQITRVGASFYHSERVTDPNRTPEARMGHAFVSSWLDIGDRVTIGNIGTELFAVKEGQASITEEGVRLEIARKANDQTILALAKKAEGKPSKKTYEREDYLRNVYVVSAAIIRSNGRCEMPFCSNSLFVREDGNPYLEVHHVVPLGEGGDDTLANVAALCPHCHRELHFGKRRLAKRAVLAGYIASLK